MRLPALIFDFGNVVAFFDYLKAFNRFGERLGVPGEEVRARLLEHGFPQLLARLESGDNESRRFCREPHDAAGALAGVRRLRSRLGRHLLAERAGGATDRLAQVAGYTLILGSNTNRMHASYFRRSLPRRSTASTHSFSPTKSVISSRIGDSTMHASAPRALPQGRVCSLTTSPKTYWGLERPACRACSMSTRRAWAPPYGDLGVEVAPGEC